MEQLEVTMVRAGTATEEDEDTAVDMGAVVVTKAVEVAMVEVEVVLKMGTGSAFHVGSRTFHAMRNAGATETSDAMRHVLRSLRSSSSVRVFLDPVAVLF